MLKGMSRPAVAYINLANLRHNFRVLEKQAGSATVMAVIKANAYGHGMHLVAPALLDEGCRCFAVTDAEEGAALRRITGNEAVDITLLSGIFDAGDAELCKEHALTPVLTEAGQVEMLAAAGFHGHAWLKVDTGMGRLGAADAPALHAACTAQGIGIAGMMSHLACADEPGHALNAQQVARFREIASSLPDDTPRSLLNSAGMISMAEHAYDVVRPGIALYGAEPIADIPLDLKPVMRLCARVIQLRDVGRGETLSYGASFTAPEDMRIATAAAGYADGLPRLLSNRGQAASLSHGETAILPIVGRICMDYCLLDASRSDVATGSEIEFWGDALPATRVAAMVGTIAYELFTGVGERVTRIALE